MFKPNINEEIEDHKVLVKSNLYFLDRYYCMCCTKNGWCSNTNITTISIGLVYILVIKKRNTEMIFWWLNTSGIKAKKKVLIKPDNH